MKYFIQLLSPVLFSLWFVGTSINADSIHPGEYILSHGNGSLVIEQKNKKKTFSIFAIGGNLHICQLSGQLIGTTAETEDAVSCRIKMTPSPDGQQITVRPKNKACHGYCGMRASFDGVYRKPQSRCTYGGQQITKDAFIRKYRAKQFNEAIAVLRPMLGQCYEFIDWVEMDKVRNDLALAYYHAGNTKQCIKTLRNTRAFRYADKDALAEGMAIFDFEVYLPIAQMSWHNMALCGIQPMQK